MNNMDYALLAAKAMVDKKAYDVMILDIAEKSSFADYFVLATAGSQRQLGALSDEVEEKMEVNQLFAKRIEGKRTDSGWVLMDFGDVIVNIFTEEMRSKYNLEKVWADCKVIEVEE